MSRCADEPEHCGSTEVARRSSYGPAAPMGIDSDSRDRDATRLSTFSPLLVTDRLISEMRVCAAEIDQVGGDRRKSETGVVSRLQEYDVLKGQLFASPCDKLLADIDATGRRQIDPLYHCPMLDAYLVATIAVDGRIPYHGYRQEVVGTTRKR